MVKVTFFIFLYGILTNIITAERSFTIDYENNGFLMDGKTFRYISGSIHYFRIHPADWEDRLWKMKAAGLNAVEFYIPWNFHQMTADSFDFYTEQRNITRFLALAQKMELFVLVRPGPYICAEWENGGFPWWLLKSGDIKLRTNDKRFMTAVKYWFKVLFAEVIVPYLYKYGGPIIMIQVENEYGSFAACDVVYRANIRDMIRQHVGYDTILFTVDGAGLSYVSCGYIPDVYPTVDFGPTSTEGVENAFEVQRIFAPRGPLINSEFYSGWFSRWGTRFYKTETEPILKTMSDMYRANASFNLYMFHGGTNFGYWNGATPLPNTSVITSYDYDAPISEAGDITHKYVEIRNMIQNLTNATLPPLPQNSSKSSYGNVNLTKIGPVTLLLNILSPKKLRKASKYPLTFERLNFPYGFVLYKTKLRRSGSNLSCPGLQDRGYVTINDAFQGIIDYWGTEGHKKWLKIDANEGQNLQILVENRGRPNYKIRDNVKGISANVTLDGTPLENWIMYPICLEKMLHVLKRRPRKFKRTRKHSTFAPSIFYGKFVSCTRADTFLDPTNWGKGQAIINGFNLGRYWPKLGPQLTLYTPKPILKFSNHIVLLELEQAGNCIDNGKKCAIHFRDTPVLNKMPGQREIVVL